MRLTETSAARILLVEDDAGLRMALQDRLSIEGYMIDVATMGDEGEQKAAQGTFDLLVLDIMLPRRSGLDVCRNLRRDGVNVPILMLTARDQTGDKVLGLKLGADDYVTKPFEMSELLARVEALLRRGARDPGGAPVRFGEVEVDLRRLEVRKRDKPVELAAKEFQLLRYFLLHRGEALSREVLLREVWALESGSSRTLDVHVATLRQKLEDDPGTPRWILTIHGFGYRFSR